MPLRNRLRIVLSGSRIATLLLLLAALPAIAAAQQTAMDRVFDRMYNFDFDGANAILDAQERADGPTPLTHSVRAATIFFGELDRLRILETDFFMSDKELTRKKRLKPDPAVRARLFAETGTARKLAGERLAVQPWDRDAMFAMCMATGIETDYTMLVEKRYFRSFSLSRESQMYARRLLELKPPVYDAYITLGAAEYLVGSLNFFFRLFVRFDQIDGSKQKAIEELTAVVEHGRYYPAFAKILLAVIHLREKRPAIALKLLENLAHEYPENRLFKVEVNRVKTLMARK